MKQSGDWQLLRIVYGMHYQKFVLILIKLYKIMWVNVYQLIFLQLHSDLGWAEIVMVILSVTSKITEEVVFVI